MKVQLISVLTTYLKFLPGYKKKGRNKMNLVLSTFNQVMTIQIYQTEADSGSLIGLVMCVCDIDLSPKVT